MGAGGRNLFESVEDMKISFIATVLNEEKTVEQLLESLTKQTRMPDEIIIVDGGSSDKTLESIKYYVLSIKGEKRFRDVKFKIIEKRGNRAVGRNEAVKQASGDIIVCSDAGCELDRDWVKNIVEPFSNVSADVVAGFYAAKPTSIFQKCLVPYVLVMPDRVDPNNFLPATRSMAFTKKIWEKVGEFPEGYSYNEDYVFAHKLKNNGAIITFAKDAVVYWQPRKNLKEAFVMFFSFAYGDAQARIYRPKVLLIFLRYILGVILVFYYFNTLYLILFSYVVWAISKNYKYVREWRAVVFLPILQVTADIAVILGTIWGIQHKR